MFVSKLGRTFVQKMPNLLKCKLSIVQGIPKANLQPVRPSALRIIVYSGIYIVISDQKSMLLTRRYSDSDKAPLNITSQLGSLKANTRDLTSTKKDLSVRRNTAVTAATAHRFLKRTASSLARLKRKPFVFPSLFTSQGGRPRTENGKVEGIRSMVCLLRINSDAFPDDSEVHSSRWSQSSQLPSAKGLSRCTPHACAWSDIPAERCYGMISKVRGKIPSWSRWFAAFQDAIWGSRMLAKQAFKLKDVILLNRSIF